MGKRETRGKQRPFPLLFFFARWGFPAARGTDNDILFPRMRQNNVSKFKEEKTCKRFSQWLWS